MRKKIIGLVLRDAPPALLRMRKKRKKNGRM